MNVILKRRQLILATLVIALGAAVFVNWYYTGNNSLAGEETTDPEYVQNLGEAKYVNATGDTTDTTDTAQSFDEMKWERKKKDDEALNKLNTSLKAAVTGSEEAKTITASVKAITERSKAETDLEALIKSKTKSECFVSLSDNKAQVIVPKGVLNEKTSLQILELVTTNTNVKPADVVMSENK